MSDVLLIDPATSEALQQKDRADALRRLRYLPHLGLLVLANHASGHDVRIIDERVEPLDPATVRADLVGITVRTALAPRAHALARLFSARGIPVVFGGPYATLSPELALRDPAVTSTVQGPGEAVWPGLLDDLGRGHLQRRYVGHAREAPSGPFARTRSRLYRPATALMQAIKGCNFRCSFCVVPKLYDEKLVVPGIDALLASVAASPHTNLFVVDDNFIANRPLARAFCAGLRGLHKRWVCQATLNLACDREMMALMSAAGCVMVNIGLETLDAETWRRQEKRQNFSCSFPSAISRLHDHGILVSGGLVFGFDEDDPSVFDRTLHFVRETRLDFPACHILTPYPGLPLYHEMKREGRILTDDLSRYNSYEVVFQPRRMAPEELQTGFASVVKELYSTRSILTRFGQAMTATAPFAALASVLGGVIINTNLKRKLPMHA